MKIPRYDLSLASVPSVSVWDVGVYMVGADLGILRGGGGGCAGILRKGGVRVQVRENFHILTSKRKQPGGGGLNPLTPPPPDPPLYGRP